uniref:SH3 domain-binding glutamic acid-rich-like protein 3 n=2 Tax=Podarcis TaxID=42163 RepID=A0A670ITT8_PODMU
DFQDQLQVDRERSTETHTPPESLWAEAPRLLKESESQPNAWGQRATRLPSIACRPDRRLSAPHARGCRPHWPPRSHAGRGWEGSRFPLHPFPPLPSRHPPSSQSREGAATKPSIMASLTVYSTSVTGSREIKSQQSEVTRILDGKNIKYTLVDISQDNALRDEMRAKSGNPKAIPPQIFNGDHYCGDYELFVEAVEQKTLQEFLKLA